MSLTQILLLCLVLAVALVAAGVFLFCKVAVDIWDEAAQMGQHEVLMRRMEMRLMLEDMGYEIPEWLDDEAEENNKDNKVVLRLVKHVPETETSDPE